jgi:hypothetical protein
MCGQVAIEDFRVKGSKEERIIRILEPIMSQHRLVFDKKPIKDETNQRQITRLTEKRGSLKHDDRVDILASAVHHWENALAISPDQQVQRNRDKETKETIKEWLGNKRILGILGEKVSGAILVNNKELKQPPMNLKDRFKRRLK